MLESLVRPFMQSRQDSLEQALHGLERTGTPLVSELPDGQLAPAGFTDDVGIYWFIPALARWLDIPVDQAQVVFFWGLMVSALVVGLIATWRLFRSWPERLVATIALGLLATYGLFIWDVYVISAIAPLLLIPAFLAFLDGGKVSRWHAGFFFLAGLLMASSNLIRSHSGTVVLIFMVVALGSVPTLALKTRVAFALFLVAGLAVIQLVFTGLIANRDAYLVAHQPGYLPVEDVHPIWHNLYIGFGYLAPPFNPFGITYSDTVADQAARSVNPDVDYVSAEYEAILKQQVFEILRTEPRFFFDTIFAKLGIVFFFLLKFANLGLVAKLITRLPAWQEWAFWAAMAFGALPGLLVIPTPHYLLSFLALATLYGLSSINAALAKGWLGLVRARA
ncbi:hypothetical protein HY375_01460 [Candidatus Berkelbacteria bacterium]|nr:hypothetical protein [Candidatus Berkelbacteria bacterium]